MGLLSFTCGQLLKSLRLRYTIARAHLECQQDSRIRERNPAGGRHRDTPFRTRQATTALHCAHSVPGIVMANQRLNPATATTASRRQDLR